MSPGISGRSCGLYAYPRTLWICCFLLRSLFSVHGTEVSFQAGISALDSAITEIPHIGFNGETEVLEDGTIDYHFRGTLQLDQPLNHSLSLSVRLLQDPLLQRRILGRLNFTYEWLTLKAGPFLGIVNTADSLITPGMSVFIGARVPGLMFGSMEAETTILTSIDGHTQNHGELKLGALLPGIVPSLSMDIIYTERREIGYTVGRKQTRYGLFLDAAGPQEAYTIHLALGYQELGWTVYAPEQTVVYQLNSIYGAVHLSCRLMPGITIAIGGLIPMYSWITKQEVKALTPPNPLFYDFTLGVIWSRDFRR
ncbi:MAG: hypothetical protein LBD55_08035 [Treponema sp.]|jgi:hypothetical protein|nr:hypothetical protein [Treponema sp.]